MRRRAAFLLTAVLLLLTLSGCASRDRVDLPQLRELKEDLLAYSRQVTRVSIYHYSTSPYLSIDIDCQNLSEQDVFALVRIIRDTVSNEDFQRDLYNLVMREDGWELVMSGQYYPWDMDVAFYGPGWICTFGSRLFSDGTAATGGKGTEYDGYSTWWGSSDEDRYFSNEEIMNGGTEK